MKRLLPLLLLPVALVGIAATTYTITQLTANNSPSDGTLIEIYDPSASPKSGKYVLTNLARATQAGITNSLGYVPVNKAGDTGIGALALSVAANSTPFTIGGYSLTGSAANSLLDLSGTWNTSGNPSALKLTITDTASGSTAKAIEVLGGAAGSTALFSVSKSGAVSIPQGVNLNIGTATLSDLGSGQLSIKNIAYFQTAVVQLASTVPLAWSSAAIGSSSDVFLLRDAANTLALRNGANAQTLRLYNTYTDASNYERFEIVTGADVTVQTAKAGTGANRNLLLRATGELYLGSSGNNRWKVDQNGHLLTITDNTYDIGASGATRPRSIYCINTYANSSGEIGFENRIKMTSDGSGLMKICNQLNNDFGRLMFGGTTASFPAIKRSSAGFADVVADDSGPTYRLGSTLVSAKTADYSVTAGDSRTTFTNEGTTANRNNTLPGAAAGLTYTFIVQDADGLTVTAAAGDTIRVAASVTSAAGNISATTIGNVVTLTAINATEWIATSVVGTWTISP